MERTGGNGSILTRYLLGELSEDTCCDIEARYFADDDLYQELLATECDLIDRYACGNLSVSEREQFERYFLLSPDRHRKVRYARALIQDRPATAAPEGNVEESHTTFIPLWFSSFFSSNWRLVALALLLLGPGVGAWLFYSQTHVGSGVEALSKLYSAHRPVQARISAFNYAPWVPERGNITVGDERNLRQVEISLSDAVTENPCLETYHASGLFYLTQQKFDLAIKDFELALKAGENNARLYSDFGAALLEQGKFDHSEGKLDKAGQEYARSLEHLNKAIELDGSLREPLFNRALLYQEKPLRRNAEKDWREYLERDQDSPWAEEAKNHLNDLEEIKKEISKSNEQILEEFMTAYQASDDATAWRIQSRNKEAITGRLIPWQLLGHHLALTGRHGTNADRRYIRALAYAGKLEARKTGDQYVSDLARIYESASANQLALLSRAHELMNRGHAFCSKSRYTRARKSYSRASKLFHKAGNSPEAWFADYWISYCYRYSNKAKARPMTKRLVRTFEARNYHWLLAVSLKNMANIVAHSSEYSKSIELNKRSLEISERLEDYYGIQKSLGQLARDYQALGNYNESLLHLRRCLDLAKTVWPGARQMWRNCDTAAAVFNSLGWFAAAADYESEGLQLGLEEKDPSLIYLPYLHLGIIRGEQKKLQEGLELAERGYKTIEESMTGKNLVDELAYSSLVLGHLNRIDRNFETSLYYYNAAIESYTSSKSSAHIYAARKGKVLCYIGQGKDSKASKEIKTVLALVNKHRANIAEETNRNAFLETEQNIYDVAIEFAYSRKHDPRLAFGYSDQSRARALLDFIKTKGRVKGTEKSNDLDLIFESVSNPLTCAEIQRRMPEGIQILQYAVLDDRLLIWLVTKKGLDLKEIRITRGELKEKALSFHALLLNLSDTRKREAEAAAKELYDILIAPFESKLDPRKQLCLIPDKMLCHLPFAALVSPAGEYFVKKYSTSCASSSSLLVIQSETARHREAAGGESVLSVGNPSYDKQAFPSLDDIDSAADEAEELARYYPSPRSRVITGASATESVIKSEMKNYEVIHLASHYKVDEKSPMFSKLLLARDPAGSTEAGDGTLQAHEVYATKLTRTRLAVLSACDTGVERYYDGEGMMGLARAFMAAGVPLVVASMWPVDSDATKELMVSFHMYRKIKGLPTVEALRRAQMDMQASPTERYRQPHYWASFVLFGGHAEF